MKTTRRSDKVLTKVRQTVKKAARKGGFLDRSIAKLSRSERQQLQKAFKALNSEFVIDKATLIKDTMSEILLHRGATPNILLQRNVWASVDAIALHCDHTGVTRALQTFAAKMFRGVRLDHPEIVSLECQLVSDVMGGEAELSRLGLLSFPEISEVITYAEKHRSGPRGLRDIARKSFSFQEAMARACGRPDKMLDVVIHSPQAAKVVIAIVLLIANIVAVSVGIALGLETLGLGFLIGMAVAVVTAVVIWIVVGAGC